MIIPTPMTSIPEANAYLGTVLDSDSWFNASPTEQYKALCEATVMINRLNFQGEKSDLSQVNAFPRSDLLNPLYDGIIPDDIKFSVSELALSLLQGRNINLEVETLTAVEEGITQHHTVFNRSVNQEHTRAGIVSFKAWSFLRPYLRDTTIINFYRGD